MVNHPSILTCGYSEAAMFLRKPQGANVHAIISIHGPNEYGIETQVNNRLDLNFDDVEADPDPADIIAVYHAIVRKRENAENGRALRSPVAEDANRIIKFAESIKDVQGMVLCHCAGGISRSPAAAILCLAVWTGPGNEDYCVNYVLQRRICAIPHTDVVRFGDQLLGREGRLIDALRR